MKAFITAEIHADGLQILQQAGIGYDLWPHKYTMPQEQLIEICKGYDALLSTGANNLNKTFLEQSRHLKALALHAVGYDNVDIATATALRIPVGNTPGVLSQATADTAFLLMLATSRKAFYLHKTINKGEWKFFDPIANLGMELKGKTLGIYGLGAIGFVMAEQCKAAYGMKIIYHNRHRNEKAEQSLGAEFVSFDNLLRQSDVLSVHCALTAETKHRFNLDAFRQMKPSSIFINTARGGIHVEEDLRTALGQNYIWGAGLDVTNPEPMMVGNPLLDMPNVCILPHIGSATVEARSAMSRLAAENIVAIKEGRKMPNWVNPF
jgi:lactate dehydrogenase-like 2-hydroxyacid dehydrogenase